MSDVLRDYMQAAIEVTSSKSVPPIEDAFACAAVAVPRNAWLSALALACQFRADHPADDDTPLTLDELEEGLADADATVTAGGGTFFVDASFSIRTRGELRRLAAALGVTLKG